MSAGSIISMVLIVGVIVGGFSYFLSIAMRKEKEKE